jgi:hypothetical protein
MNVVPTDGRWVGGTHGRLPDDPAEGPVLLCGDTAGKRDHIRADEVRDLVLDLAGCRADT